MTHYHTRSSRNRPWVVATDGSVDHVIGLAAYAWVGSDGRQDAVVVEGLDSTTAELHAVEAALLAAPAGRPVQLLLDHQVLADALRAAIRGEAVHWESFGRNHQLANCWSRVCRLLAELPVGVNWVRGHASNGRNNKVDVLARSTLRAARPAFLELTATAA